MMPRLHYVAFAKGSRPYLRHHFRGRALARYAKTLPPGLEPGSAREHQETAYWGVGFGQRLLL